jgi:hypothetical protein
MRLSRCAFRVIYPMPLLRFLPVLLVFFIGPNVSARGMRMITWDMMAKEADLVVVITPVNTATHGFQAPPNGTWPRDYFVGLETTCKVESVLKGDEVQKITILHLTPSKKALMATNGPSLIYFDRNEKKRETGQLPSVDPNRTWLAYLKKRKDGLWEPVHGHVDSAHSFRRLD